MASDDNDVLFRVDSFMMNAEVWMRALDSVMEGDIYEFAHGWYLDLEDFCLRRGS